MGSKRHHLAHGHQLAVGGRDVQVTIMGYTGHSYQLQYTSELRSVAWSNLGTAQIGSQAPLVFTHTNGVAASQGFYRVVIDPPG